MKALTFQSLDEALIRMAVLLRDEGKKVEPRGLPTLEVTNVGFTLTNPRSRLIWNPARRWNPFLAIGEFIWHLAGSRDASAIAHYAPRWADYATCGVIPGSSYGYKLFRGINGRPSQWDQLKELLINDPSSRRAVVSLYSGPQEMSYNSPDVACVLSVQFLVRDQRLHASVVMRSNDLIWGMCYDGFLFTMLQETLACDLGLGLGEYSHFVTSLHAYDRHANLLRRIAESDIPFDALPMPLMTDAPPVDLLVLLERSIRLGAQANISGVSSYWSQLLHMLLLHESRQTGDERSERAARSHLSGSIYERLLQSTDANEGNGWRAATRVRKRGATQ